MTMSWWTPELRRDFSKILERLVGFEAPFTAACIARNGLVFTLRWDVEPGGSHEEVGTTILVDDGPTEGPTLPIHVLIVDRRGDSAAFVLEAPGRINKLYQKGG